MQQVLVVDDDPAMRDHMQQLLSEVENINVDVATTEEEANSLALNKTYDLAILDIELGNSPKARHAGLKLAVAKIAPVALFVSGTCGTELRSIFPSVFGFDFLEKPFDDAEFVFKVELSLKMALLSKSQEPLPKVDLPHGLRRNPKNRVQYLWKNNAVHLSTVELAIVELLVSSFGSVVTHKEIENVCRTGRGANLVSKHISDIRNAFVMADPAFSEIKNEPGRGYMWIKRD